MITQHIMRKAQFSLSSSFWVMAENPANITESWLTIKIKNEIPIFLENRSQSSCSASKASNGWKQLSRQNRAKMSIPAFSSSGTGSLKIGISKERLSVRMPIIEPPHASSRRLSDQPMLRRLVVCAGSTRKWNLRTVRGKRRSHTPSQLILPAFPFRVDYHARL